ncbi:MAG: FAD-binding oxidoreductase [Myxococcales bacterium]|nr:FAD-binding oxidoreductase [Myxococcales bacterium]
MVERARCHWGWGFADKFPDEGGLRALGGSLGMALGFEAQEPRSPRPIGEAQLPASTFGARARPPFFFDAGPEARIRHTYGRGFRDLARGFVGDFSAAPDAVAFPLTEDDVEALFAYAERERLVLVPFGGGTSVVGGVECPRPASREGVVAVDLRHFDRVLEVDPVSLSARIQGGAFGPAIEAALGREGLTLRHFPQSFEFSTLGGWIATRAGGHFATLYTHIDDLVESVRMVTPAGPFETRRLPASGAGPDPNGLVKGSEGTLGLITEAWMKVRRRPRKRAQTSVRFKRFEDGVAAVRRIVQAPLYPANCRLIDATEALLNGVDFQGNAVLLLAFESDDVPLEGAMQTAVELARECGGEPIAATRFQDGVSGGDESSAAWRRSFFEAPYVQSRLLAVGIMVDTFETACTWRGFEALHAVLTADVTDALKRVCGAGRLTCRFTHAYPDGPAPYYTFFAPFRRGSELSQWAEVKAAASEAISRNGATITHHHAVGRVHRPWYERERPPLMEAALRAVKRTFDPAGLLNPGVLFDP